MTVARDKIKVIFGLCKKKKEKNKFLASAMCMLCFSSHCVNASLQVSLIHHLGFSFVSQFAAFIYIAALGVGCPFTLRWHVGQYANATGLAILPLVEHAKSCSPCKCV